MTTAFDSSSSMSVTIKADEPGGKYNDPKSPGSWIIFHGSPKSITEQIIETFDLGKEAADQPLFSLVNEATRLFKATANLSAGLGGVSSVPSGQGKVLDSGLAAEAGGDVWKQAEAAQSKPKEAPADPILTAIEQCTSVAALQQVWAENQAAFGSNPNYMDAYKVKGRALQAA